MKQLTDSKLEQTSFLLTTFKNVDILFLLETFLKPSKPTRSTISPVIICFEKIELDKKAEAF